MGVGAGGVALVDARPQGIAQVVVVPVMRNILREPSTCAHVAWGDELKRSLSAKASAAECARGQHTYGGPQRDSTCESQLVDNEHRASAVDPDEGIDASSRRP